MLKIKQLKGRINYVEALNKMNSKVLEVSEDIKNEEIWFLEHQSVFTAGSSTPKNFNQKKKHDKKLLEICGSEKLFEKVNVKNQIICLNREKTNTLRSEMMNEKADHLSLENNNLEKLIESSEEKNKFEG